MKNIAVFTGTRAEYGLLFWLLKSLAENDNVSLQLLVGGTHLSNEFGHTIDQINKDGFSISAKLDYLSSSDSPLGVANSLALAITSAAKAFEQLRPDILVILGDMLRQKKA